VAKRSRRSAHGWEDFRNAVEAGYRREGYEVRRSPARTRTSSLPRRPHVARRVPALRVARTGIEPLRQLHAAAASANAHECLYLCVARSPATRSPLPLKIIFASSPRELTRLVR